ncbi:1-acyl-sn-glycerol-3-phosphate acyltransferase [Arcticibacterium luteifluviistationis]|uniref:Glycerol acyltransferase n=1 Tax=Arcticibacterium luteifluviistationis TaxID=1784714 RepID=A0A2Z4GEV7_9BACT|nr:1-acyl-sn-glycerol-3-phosphate acyltransferase [Arcticibacterium luteifluviistationis]AWV99654.1 glycerol acyltransferase [Arcticibacterium luteifluviistationis]
MDTTGIENVPKDKPILFASTHANSFYDAIVLHIVFKRYVYALARGDAFKKPIVAKILNVIHMLPVWRISEGRSNMAKNAKTFEKCNELFKQNKQVLIYPEGICKNQTTLLPLKKRGTAAMAFKAWNEDIDVQVVPVVLTYDSFKTFGKRINLNFGKPLQKESFDLSEEVSFSRDFTATLTEKMEPLFNHTFKPVGFLRNAFHYFGWLINFPLYLAIDTFVKKKFGKTIFSDSIWFGVLYLTYPLYLILLIFGLSFIF